MSYLSLRGFVERASSVENTQKVLRETDAVLSDLKDIESGARGYLMSDEKPFLDPYLDGLASIPAHLDRLKELTVDNAYQQERLRNMEGLIDRRLQQVAVLLKSAHFNRLVLSVPVKQQLAAGKLTMDKIRDFARDMNANAEIQLARRAEDSKHRATMTAAVIIAGTLISLAMLIVAFVLFKKEIGRRARAEQTAQASAAETTSLYNSAPCGYHSVDKDGTFVRINDTELAWLGYERGEVIGKLKFIDIVAPECAQTVRDNFPKLLRGGQTTELEYTLVRKDGSTFPVAVNAAAQLDAHGNFEMSRTTVFDISALHASRVKLEETLAFLDTIVENIPSMIFVKDAQTLRFARMNAAEEKLLGASRETLIGKSDHDLFPSEQADFFAAKDRETLATFGVVEIAEESLTVAGEVRILRTRKIALRDAQGRPKYLLGISDDITEARRAEESIRALNASLMDRANQLEAANKELESFSYSVSHDLRAPLRAIDGFSKIVEEEYGKQLDEEGLRLLRVVRDNSQRMGILIDDLLAFSRLGRQPLSSEWMDMKLLATSALAEVQATGFGGNARALIHDLPKAHADPALLKQVWVNLLSNAVKYSSTRSEPHIEVGFMAPKNADDPVTYFVKDNGVGFDMRYYDRLFGVFQRLHRVDEFSGTGVGLAIVHRLIARHGGRVWAEAELDQGATFYFTLSERGNDDGL